MLIIWIVKRWSYDLLYKKFYIVLHKDEISKHISSFYYEVEKNYHNI